MDNIQSMDYARLKNAVSRFGSVKVLVIGDLILDEFIWGQVTRISPEAPIPVVWVKSESFVPGGACNVANNIRALGGQAGVIGVIGSEGRGRMLLELLQKTGIETTGIIKDPARPTTLKTRVVAHHQQVVRIDREEVAPLSREVQKKILTDVKRRIRSFDAICVEDYGKGVITPELVQEIVRLSRRYGKIITVDPKESHLSYYRGVSCITPNHHEASTLAKIIIRDDASLTRAGQKLLRVLECQNVLITRGENGMCLFQKGLKPVKIPTLAQDVFDVSGAGDTVIGTYTLALASKASAIEAAHLANCAAGIVVGKVGTATVTQGELLARVRQLLSVTV
jgi:D-beta-D-heptose 7-phosphate kinase/D-beta-D-heptose 1-phosphate adenosyltransferase